MRREHPTLLFLDRVREIIRSVACPTCTAHPAEPCVNANGEHQVWHHAARIAAASSIEATR